MPLLSVVCILMPRLKAESLPGMPLLLAEEGSADGPCDGCMSDGGDQIWCLCVDLYFVQGRAPEKMVLIVERGGK